MATPTLLKLTKRERAAIDSYLEDQAAAPLPPPPPSRASNRPAPQPNGDATRAALTKTKKDALRAALPAFQHRAAILDTIDAHAVTILRGATGCGKSFTMLFLARLLMKSVDLSSPTIVLITDRTDLDDQLSGTFTNAKGYIGDESIISVESREHLRELLKGRNSGGVFLTTIHKFTEDTELLTERSNVICISDEAHRSQVNLDQKLKITEDGVLLGICF